jgi:hypothetical protein
VLIAIAIVLACSPVRAADRYVEATVDQQGQLRIRVDGGHEIRPKLSNGQVGFDTPAISPDRRSVGWLGLFPNCCTSYPIPLTLSVMTEGRTRVFVKIGSQPPIFFWCFEADGKQIAFHQETVHGELGVHYELRDVANGRLAAEWNPEYDRNNRLIPNQVGPTWVLELDAAMRAGTLSVR